MEFSHKPVLLTEAIDALEIKLGGIYVDLSLIHISEPTRPY